MINDLSPKALKSGDIAEKWRIHLIDQALPFWHQQGFDRQNGLYHERLSWQGDAVYVPQLRLMVQARQIATYCRAQLDGLYHEGYQHALEVLERVERLYYQSDDELGWVFALKSDGQTVNPLRDLYAHAFILFAYSWAYRLTQKPHYAQIAQETALTIDRIFALEHGGFATSVPCPNNQRSQNPHMHLLEAYLALYEATGDCFYLTHATQIVTLAERYFIEPQSGVLYEFMDQNWHPQNLWGRNRVEPGHLFEWSWLFNEYQRLAELSSSDSERLRNISKRLFQAGCLMGCDEKKGLAFDAITEDGTILERSTRIWPQTELIRRQNQLINWASHEQKQKFYALNLYFLDHYMPLSLNGGWVDQRDEHLKARVDYMPASSLYHIYSAGREMISTVAYNEE